MAIVTGGNTEPNPNEDNKDINSKESMIGLRRESIAANTLEQAFITNNFLREILDTNRAVSYTHLTLPTILLV